MAIETGDRVQIHYRGRIKDGDEFDTSHGGDPLTFHAGSEELIPAVSFAVIGMEVGEKKTVDVPPELGYGPRNDELVIKVHSSQLPDGVEVGSMLGINTPDGQLQVIVTALDGDEAILDGNHPLAGQTLVFDLEIVALG